MKTYYSLTLESGNHVYTNATRNNKPAPWSPAGHGYTIRASYMDKRWQFNYWDSAHNAQHGNPPDIRGALACWAGDCWAGKQFDTVKEIMDEFGYDNASEARRVLKGCKKSAAQADRIGISDEDLEELANY